MNRSMVWACRASPTHHDRATLTYNPCNNLHNAPQTPATTLPTPATPAYMRARARPIRRARALPTNRHEGGSLT